MRRLLDYFCSFGNLVTVAIENFFLIEVSFMIVAVQ